MGQCTNCVKLDNNKGFQYSKQPGDTMEYQTNRLSYKLQKLNFQGELENIQMVNYPFDIISMRFSINQVLDFTLPRQRNEFNSSTRSSQIGNITKIKWRYDEKFCFSMDQYEIRKSFIRIFIFKEQLIPILQLKLNLFQIITGPVHHDLGLQFEKNKSSRLLFDFKISQNFQLLINPIDVEVHLNQQYPGNQFNYSFNAYSCSQRIYISDGSIPKKASIFSNFQGNYRALKPQDQCQSPTRIRKGTNLNKMIKNVLTSQVIWNKQEQVQTQYFLKQSHQILQEQMAMPSFKFALKSNNINKSSLQFILWSIQVKNSLMNQAIIFGDCYISIAKLLENDCIILEQLQTKNNGDNGSGQKSKKIKKKIQSRISVIQDPLFQFGKSVGKIKIKFKIINQSHYSQLYHYAKTQDGIIYMNSMFKVYRGGNTKKKQTNTSIIKIQKIFQNIAQSIYSYNLQSKEKRKNWGQFNTLEKQIFQEFKELHNKLEQTLQESFILSKRHQVIQMMDSQNLILNILERIYIFLEEDNVKFAQQSWKLMLGLMKRGQLYLQNIGFFHFDQTLIQIIPEKKEDPSLYYNQYTLSKKVSTALKYQQIIYKTLKLALKYTFQAQNYIILQAQAFKAYCFMRVPKFREQVLKYICKDEDNRLFDESFAEVFQTNSQMSHLNLRTQQKSSTHLDWNKYFYDYLKDQERCHELDNMLKENFENNLWLQSLSDRQQNFCIFIEYFAKKMAEVGKRLKLSQYSYCSGYTKIIKSFLVQMNKRPLIQFDSCMIQTSTSLLTNSNLINIIISIVVQKTNIYNSLQINKFLNIISNYLKFLTQSTTKILPQKFNIAYFFKVIKMLLESEYSYGIAKMLVILHIYFQSFNDQLKQVLSLYLLSKAFFRLFFHWSYNVRVIFYHIFIIKIYWSKLNGVTQKQNKMGNYKNENQQIYARYKKLIKILNTVQRERLIKKKNMKKVQKQEYYIKMKKRIHQKIKQKDQQYNPKSSSKLKQTNNNSGREGSSSELDSQKQRNISQSRLQMIGQIKKQYDRSQTLCSDQIKEHLKKLKSSRSTNNNGYSLNQVQTVSKKISNHHNNNVLNRSGKNNNQINSNNNNVNHINDTTSQNDKFSINLKINNHKRINQQLKAKQGADGTVKQEIQKINQECVNLLPITHKKSFQEKPLVYTFFGNQDYELEQMSLNQENKVLLGMGQFRETQQFVERYIIQKGTAPHVNLDPEIQIDSNQPRPQQLIYI